MAVKVDTGEVEMRVVFAYAPQYVQSLEGEELLLIGGGLNGHVGSRKDDFDGCKEGYGYGARNDDGLRILEYAVAGRDIQDLKQRIKWWNLKDRKEVFFASVALSTLPYPTRSVRKFGRLLPRLTDENTLGKTTLGKPKVKKATWFWNEEVQAAIREKKSKYKLWWMTRQPEDGDAYLAAKREAKKAVSKAKSYRYRAVYDMLDTSEGERAVYRLVRVRHRSTLETEHTKIVKGADGTVLLGRSGQILQRWREYYNQLRNEEFCHHPIPTVPSVEGSILPITAVELSAALAKMKWNKATSPDDIPSHVWKLLGDRGSVWLATLSNKIVA
ncbi:hypothetical protein RB195_018524 [Necator americanus]|uniref:Uncharacterized protein n=1 Tax=Necator americanus TaxID=51031 RepID=A0ABR1CA54_NECAM